MVAKKRLARQWLNKIFGCEIMAACSHTGYYGNGNIWVVGSKQFCLFIYECLDMLYRFDTDGFDLVQQNVFRVVQSEGHGKSVYFRAGECVFGKDTRQTKDAIVDVCAGLVHCAQYGVNYFLKMPDSEKEIDAINRENKSMAELKKYRVFKDKADDRLKKNNFTKLMRAKKLKPSFLYMTNFKKGEIE